MITVILPVHNGESHLREAIDSILNQTYSKFEFLIINDGSTDRSEEIILSYKDNRIKYIKNDSNLGIVRTLNKGIDLASHKYIARMDADDISLPQRFEIQLKYMEANPEIVASGSNIIRFYNDDLTLTNPSNARLNDGDLKIRTLFYTAFWHPTMIIKAALLRDYNLRYRTDYKYSQDKALWIEISKLGLMSNIKDPLLYYRVHENQVSSKYYGEQYDISMAITRKALSELGVNMGRFSDKIVGYISYPHQCFDINEIFQVEAFMKEVVNSLAKDPMYHNEAVKSFLRGQLIKTLQKSQNIGLPLIAYIYQSRFVKIEDFDVRFFVKSFLRRNTKSKVLVK